MSNSRGPAFIDGFTSVRAASRKAGQNSAPKIRPSSNKLPEIKKQTPKDYISGKKIGHTIMPERFEITCYNCEYVFTLTGYLHETNCPKCRASLTCENYVVENEWSRDIKTIGNIEIKSNAIVTDSTLIARNISIEGNAKNATIIARQTLIAKHGAKINFATTKFSNLIIEHGESLNTKRGVTCKNIEIKGRIDAKLFIDDTATLRNGGNLRGELHGPRLIMEDGSKLKAKLVIGIRRT